MEFIFQVNPIEEDLVFPNLVAHIMKTMERYFEGIRFGKLTAGQVDLKRMEIENGDFKTFDIEFL